MKIKNTVATALIGLTFLSVGTESLTASASAWKNGLPSFVKLSQDDAWMRVHKGKIEQYYDRLVLIPTNGGGLGQNNRVFDNKGKRAQIGGSGAPTFDSPYYKKIGSNNYLVKTRTSQGSFKAQGKFKKDGKNIKLWLNDDGKKWRYLGVFKKVNLKHADNSGMDPLR